jgi:hypothetical protein
MLPFLLTEGKAMAGFSFAFNIQNLRFSHPECKEEFNQQSIVSSVCGHATKLMPTYNSFGAFKFFSYFQDRICSCFNVK